MEVGEDGKMGTERDFAWVDGHTLQCADDVLLNCTFETCTSTNLKRERERVRKKLALGTALMYLGQAGRHSLIYKPCGWS